MSLLEELLPDFDVGERHARQVAVPAAEAFDAFRQLTLAQLPVSWLLFGIRSLPDRLVGRPGLPSDRRTPLLQQFLDIGFSVLAENDRSIVVGTIAPARGLHVEGLGRRVDGEMFLDFDVPGYVKVAMEWSFDGPDVEADAVGCTITTETPVLATDDAARSRFSWYWRVIGPFSALIRREWLAALARATG
jgi:hypothetical protein